MDLELLGAILGMYGVFLALLTTNLIEKSTRKTLLLAGVAYLLPIVLYLDRMEMLV